MFQHEVPIGFFHPWGVTALRVRWLRDPFMMYLLGSFNRKPWTLNCLTYVCISRRNRFNSTFSSSVNGFSRSSLVWFLTSESLGFRSLLFEVRKIRWTLLSVVSDFFMTQPPAANRSRTPDKVAPSKTRFLPTSPLESPSSLDRASRIKCWMGVRPNWNAICLSRKKWLNGQ